MEVTIDRLKKDLKYDRITESVEDCVSRFLWKKREWKVHRFYIIPSDRTLPAIKLAFNVTEDGYSVFYVGFGRWHGHFDHYFEEERNIAEAIAFARRLIAGDIYVLEELDAKGRHRGDTAVNPQQDYTVYGPSFQTLTRKPSRIRRVVFNKPIEEIEVPNKTDAGSAADAAPDP